MPRNFAPFKIRMVGPSPDHPRFVIRDARRVAELFWTGKRWSRKLRDARLYYDPDDVAETVERLTRQHLRRHQAKRLFKMTVIVRVHADESVSRADLENYLRKALVLRIDKERFGTGPTPDSLVEVVVPAISLEEDR